MYLDDAAVTDRSALSAEYNETLMTFNSNYDLIKTFHHFFHTIEHDSKIWTLNETESNAATDVNWKLILDVDNVLLPKSEQ